MGIILADWLAPSHIVAGVSDRYDGLSVGPFANNNVALHVQDDNATVLENRNKLKRQLLKSHNLSDNVQWQWLNQTHGVNVLEASSATLDDVPDADAVFSRERNLVCCVMTADCLPILLTDQNGSQIAAIHAGWRSLCHGIIEETVNVMRKKADRSELMAWLGPAIGPSQFEVGADVLAAFKVENCGDLSEQAFVLQENGKYLTDIYQLARLRLEALGINQVTGGGFCTVNENERFYSYRRDGKTGRMASFILMK